MEEKEEEGKFETMAFPIVKNVHSKLLSEQNLIQVVPLACPQPRWGEWVFNIRLRVERLLKRIFKRK